MNTELMAFCLFRHTLEREWGLERNVKGKIEKIDYKKYWDEEISDNAKSYWLKCADQYTGEFDGIKKCERVSLCA